MRRNTQEYKIHIAVLKHVRSAFPEVKVLFHVPNQTRNKTEAFFNKELGVMAGVSDLIMGWEKNIGCLEIKSDSGRPSPSQDKFQILANSIGWHTGTVKTVRQAHHVLMSWGLTPIHSSIVEADTATWEEKLSRAREFFKP